MIYPQEGRTGRRNCKTAERGGYPRGGADRGSIAEGYCRTAGAVGVSRGSFPGNTTLAGSPPLQQWGIRV